MEPIMLAVAPNGARKTTEQLPTIPVTPEALAHTAKAVCEAGAAMLHLHIRDAKQQHTLDPERYRQAITAVQGAVGDRLIVQITSEAVGIYTPEQQIQIIDALAPEAVSLALREYIPDPADEAAEQRACAFFARTHQRGIYAQYILYSPEEVAYFGRLRKAGRIPGKKVAVLFVLGKKHAPAGDQATWSVPEDLDPFLATFDGSLKLAETLFSVCAFGGNEQACMLHTVACGGHVRIGFENNHHMPDGSQAPSNTALVQSLVQALQAQTRPLADATTARTLLAPTLE